MMTLVTPTKRAQKEVMSAPDFVSIGDSDFVSIGDSDFVSTVDRTRHDSSGGSGTVIFGNGALRLGRGPLVS